VLTQGNSPYFDSFGVGIRTKTLDLDFDPRPFLAERTGPRRPAIVKVARPDLHHVVEVELTGRAGMAKSSYRYNFGPVLARRGPEALGRVVDIRSAPSDGTAVIELDVTDIAGRVLFDDSNHSVFNIATMQFHQGVYQRMEFKVVARIRLGETQRLLVSHQIHDRFAANVRTMQPTLQGVWHKPEHMMALAVLDVVHQVVAALDDPAAEPSAHFWLNGERMPGDFATWVAHNPGALGPKGSMSTAFATAAAAAEGPMVRYGLNHDEIMRASTMFARGIGTRNPAQVVAGGLMLNYDTAPAGAAIAEVIAAVERGDPLGMLRGALRAIETGTDGEAAAAARLSRETMESVAAAGVAPAQGGSLGRVGTATATPVSRTDVGCSGTPTSREQIAACYRRRAIELRGLADECSARARRMASLGSTPSSEPPRGFGQQQAFLACRDNYSVGAQTCDCVAEEIVRLGTQLNPVVAACMRRYGLAR
jgi:hypothetical protein